MAINQELILIRQARKVEAKRRYRSTIKYRETERRYRNLPATKEKLRAAQKRHRSTEAYRAKAREYDKLPHVKEKILAYQRRRLATTRGRWLNLISQAKKRAGKLGIPWEEKLRDIILELIPTHCSCCNCKLDYSTGFKKQLHRSPSLDRIIPSFGYTISNTRVTCWRCNDLKADATISELEIVIAYMRREGLH